MAIERDEVELKPRPFCGNATAGLFEALDACEAAMSIVEPRSNKAQYLEVLAQARAALRKARGDE
jgi:hypothetical protein